MFRTYYKYKLEGIDKDWVTVADVNSVRYNSLPPGTFNFKLLLSNDNKTWQRADDEVTIIIATPFYRTWWFKMISTLVALVIIWFVWRHFRRAHIKQKEELETQIVIGYFASRINSYQKIEDVLWDVARNCYQ
jgi:p-aminobenzoyl-glutamate transporter AbgT